MDAVTQVPTPVNEPVHGYAPGSPERARLEAKLKELAENPIELPMTALWLCGCTTSKRSPPPSRVSPPEGNRRAIGVYARTISLAARRGRAG
ncbi:1-pyrroline-5-carboxylate dehydrogenase, partial [Streptomyces mirabilis]